MYIILNRANLIVSVSSAVSYVRVAENGIPVVTTPEEAEAVYSADNDTFYPLDAPAAAWRIVTPGGGMYHVEEVDAVPDVVVPGFYYFSGDFFTTPEKEAELAAERAQKAAPSVASIAFVTLAEAGQLDDVTAGEHAEQFAEWVYPIDYKTGNIRRYGPALYRCIGDHTSQSNWTPDAAVSLWTKIADPSEEWPAWAQPRGDYDAYKLGDKVSHNGNRWTCTQTDAAGNNTWEPGVYGWEVAEA